MPGNFWKNPTGTLSKTLAGNTKEMKNVGKFFNGTVESNDVNTDTYTEVYYEPISAQPAIDNAPEILSIDQAVISNNNNDAAPIAESNAVIVSDNNNETNISPISTLGDSVNIVD